MCFFFNIKFRYTSSDCADDNNYDNNNHNDHNDTDAINDRHQPILEKQGYVFNQTIFRRPYKFRPSELQHFT